jgi:hypothetical protein
LKNSKVRAKDAKRPTMQQKSKPKKTKDPVVTGPSEMRSKSTGIKYAEFVVTLQRRRLRTSSDTVS